MAIEDLLGESERSIESSADNGEVLAHLLVVDVVALLPVAHLDLLAEIGGIRDGCEATAAELEVPLASVSTTPQTRLLEREGKAAGRCQLGDGGVEGAVSSYQQLPRLATAKEQRRDEITKSRATYHSACGQPCRQHGDGKV